jgi:hypothetical protein
LAYLSHELALLPKSDRLAQVFLLIRNPPAALTDESGLVHKRFDLLDVQVARATGEGTERILATALLCHCFTHTIFPFFLAVRPSQTLGAYSLA